MTLSARPGTINLDQDFWAVPDLIRHYDRIGKTQRLARLELTDELPRSAIGNGAQVRVARPARYTLRSSGLKPADSVT